MEFKNEAESVRGRGRSAGTPSPGGAAQHRDRGWPCSGGSPPRLAPGAAVAAPAAASSAPPFPSDSSVPLATFEMRKPDGPPTPGGGKADLRRVGSWTRMRLNPISSSGRWPR